MCASKLLHLRKATVCEQAIHRRRKILKVGEKMNCKLSGIDLAAIEAYLLIIKPGEFLEI